MRASVKIMCSAVAATGLALGTFASTTAAATNRPAFSSFSQVPQAVPAAGARVEVKATFKRAQHCQLEMVSGSVTPGPTWSHNPKPCTTSDTQYIKIWKSNHANPVVLTFKLALTGKGGTASHTFHLTLAGTTPPTTTTTAPTTTTLPTCPTTTTVPSAITTSTVPTTSTTTSTVPGTTSTTVTTVAGTTTTTAPTCTPITTAPASSSTTVTTS